MTERVSVRLLWRERNLAGAEAAAKEGKDVGQPSDAVHPGGARAAASTREILPTSTGSRQSTRPERVTKPSQATEEARSGDSELRKGWSKRAKMYCNMFKVQSTSSGEEFDCFEMQPDATQSFGIRCWVCFRAAEKGIIPTSKWTTYGYKNFRIEDLKRHGMVIYIYFVAFLQRKEVA